MTRHKSTTIDPSYYVRSKLYRGNKSSLQRYAELVVGEYSLWKLAKYELLTSLFGPLPGAVGLFLRKLFYPMLFRGTGRGVIFGRNLVVRNAERITLGNRVVLDDYVVLDGRGSGEKGITIGDDVIVNRGASIQSKFGDITIGSHTDIGAGTTVVSQGGVWIGSMVSIAGGCKIGGGSFFAERADAADEAIGDPNAFDVRGHERQTRGPVRIEDRCLVFAHSVVLDGVCVGREAMLAPGSIVTQDVAEKMLATPQQRLIQIPRYGGPVSPNARHDIAGESPHAAPPSTIGDFESSDAPGEAFREATRLVFAALDELNEMRPSDEPIPKSLQAPLYGPTGMLDSMELVNLIVITEQRAQALLGASINIASETALAGEASAFVTVKTFVEHVQALLQQEQPA